MKKIAILLAGLMFIISIAINVEAAELNEHEAYIIQSISGEDATVQIEERYVNQLKNYFYQDKVDIGETTSVEFVDALKVAVEEFSKLEDGVTFEKASNAIVALEEAAHLIDLKIEYDSAVNGFYGIDYLGKLVIDPQPIIKDTDKDENSWNVSIEVIFAIAIILCLIGLLVNAKRWNNKIRNKNKKAYEEDDEDDDELEVANRKTRKARIKTMSYRSIMQLLKYFYIPIIMCVIVVIVGIGLVSLNDDLIQSINRSFINTQPLYTQTQDRFVPIYIDEAKQKAKVSTGSFEWPAYGERYGTLQSTELNIEAPVYFGDRGNVLTEGAGTYIGSSLPGMNNTILIGAHDTTYFAGLEDVAVDNTFIFTTAYGIYRYQVTDIKIVDEGSYDEAYDLSSDTEQLVLYTCYPFGTLNGAKTQRMFVYLSLVSGPELN